ASKNTPSIRFISLTGLEQEGRPAWPDAIRSRIHLVLLFAEGHTVRA
ncbi:MAG: hypothetical protein QOK29_1, partial [Rhodospirillaceae bacterium]|nr:hypothetical protein [Rhodospirillaceae bacterium]